MGAEGAGAPAVHGYTTAFWWSAAIFATDLLLALPILPAKVKPRASGCAPRRRIIQAVAFQDDACASFDMEFFLRRRPTSCFSVARIAEN